MLFYFVLLPSPPGRAAVNQSFIKDIRRADIQVSQPLSAPNNMSKDAER